MPMMTRMIPGDDHDDTDREHRNDEHDDAADDGENSGRYLHPGRPARIPVEIEQVGDAEERVRVR